MLSQKGENFSHASNQVLAEVTKHSDNVAADNVRPMMVIITMMMMMMTTMMMMMLRVVMVVIMMMVVMMIMAIMIRG